MKWKKVELQLFPWLMTAYCAARSASILSGAYLHGAAETIYSGFSPLKTADRIAAALLIVCAGQWIAVFFRKKGLRRSILSMAAWELLHGGARFFITGFTPLNRAAGLRLAAYLVWFFATYYIGGEAHERGQDPVRGDPLLQGGSGAAGDGEAAEGEDDEPASGGENIG